MSIANHLAKRTGQDCRIETASSWFWFDLVVAAIGLLFLFPLLVCIGLAIKISDGGPILYGHRRMGRKYQPFFVLKFRTMIVGADRKGSVVTGAQDNRVTRIGRVLRRYKLDELPQLVNVLRGEMALVGPRPEVQEFVDRHRAEYSELLRSRPGITDPASLAFSNEAELLSSPNFLTLYEEEILPKKLALSLEFSEHRSWRGDLTVVFRTVTGLFFVKDRTRPH